MALHFYHCTDGVDLVVDRRGRETAGRRQVPARARAVAQEIMRAVPDHDEWDGWAVHVYDGRGQVAIVPFPTPAAAMRRAA